MASRLGSRSLTPVSDTELRAPRGRRPGILRSALSYLLLLLGAVVFVIPFLWMLSTSLKPESQVFTFPPQWIPRPFTWSNYVQAVTQLPFARFFLNSVVYSGGVTILQLITSSTAAYAFAKLRMPGRNVLFTLYLATLMIPFEIIAIPDFVIVKDLGWYNSFAALIIPRAFTAFGVFLLRQAFLGLPTELDDAATIDGASRLRIFWSIVLPLSKPALATLAIFVFLGEWTQLLWPLIVTDSQDMTTLSLGLATFQGQYGTQWNLMMAGSAIAIIPVLIVFLVGQRHFIRSVAMSGFG
ncbi:MAG: carbohydrate ABC transporter permease, partial [Candidatus Dormiibacterota bacterium]